MSEAPEIGDEITICYGWLYDIMRAVVVDAPSGQADGLFYFHCNVIDVGGGAARWRAIADEGITWCCGWEGEAVEALKAAAALMREPGATGATGPTGVNSLTGAIGPTGAT